MLREMIAFAAERLMEIEVGALTGAAHGEKSPARLVQICQNCCLMGTFLSVQNRFAFKSFNGGRKMFGQPAPVIAPPNQRNVDTDQRAGLMREESDEGTCA